MFDNVQKTQEQLESMVRAKHRRSGDPGLWVRNKEQWADCRVMTANTRVRGLRRVSRSSSIRRPLSSNRRETEMEGR